MPRIYFLWSILFIFSTAVHAQCWRDLGENPAAKKLTPQHIYQLREMLKNDTQCGVIGVSSHEAFMIYNRKTAAFWEIHIEGVDIYNNSSPLVRNSMQLYFHVAWKTIAPLDANVLNAQNKQDYWKVGKSAKRRRRGKKVPNFVQGQSGLAGKMPFSTTELAYLKQTMPQRFRISYFRNYLH